MALTFNNTGLPGYGTAITSSSKTFLRSMDRYSELAGGVILKGTMTRDIFNAETTVITNGTLLGRITATSLYRPTVIGVTGAAVSAGTVTSITVTAASAIELQRLITAGQTAFKIVGPPSASGTVAATSITGVSATGTTFTISSATLPAVTNGSYITSADGSETPKGMLSCDYGQRVTDYTGASADTSVGKVVISGDIVPASIYSLAAVNADCLSYLKGLLNTEGRTFTWSDSY